MLIGTFSRALEGKPKRKRNITGNIRYQPLRDTAKRVCGYSPEVMVRITSYGKGAGNALANLGYISRTDAHAERHGKEDLELETDRGEILIGEAAIRDYAQGWEHDFGKPNKRRRDTMRMLLSMPEGTNPEAVRNATRDFAWQTFAGRHEYVFVLHTDEPHPHCHLTVKMLGHDGTRLDVGREDLASWRELFAQTLRDYGVDAVATRRAARGVVRKAEKSVVQHIADSPRKGKPRVPKVVALRERDAIAALIAEQQGQSLPPRPWEASIRSEQDAVRNAWLAAAEQLERSPFGPILLPEDHYARVQRAQQRGAAYQVRLAAPLPGVAPRPAASLEALGAVRLQNAGVAGPHANVPTLASIHGGIWPILPQPVFLPADHHARVRHNQQRGAAYQARLAAPRAGEPPHPTADLSALPGIKPVPYHGNGLTWRQRRPLAVGSLGGMPRLADMRSPQARAQPGRIPPPPVFKQEIQHERPTPIQHDTALYQSHLAAPRAGPARTVPSLRELPGVDVVRHKSAQVLLQPDARHRLGWRAGADHGLRRAGPGPDGDRPGTGREGGTHGKGSEAQGIPASQVQGSRDGGGNRGHESGAQGSHGGPNAAGSVSGLAGILKLSDVTSTAASDKMLAQDIRAFVAAMPAVETTRDVLKRELAGRFTSKTVEQTSGQEKGADQAAPKGKGLGL
jgi:hypothetical protein